MYAVLKCESRTHFITSAKPIASSMPGMANARSCIMPFMPLSSPASESGGLVNTVFARLQARDRAREIGRTRLDHVLHARARVDLHGEEVGEAVDLARLLAELLRERVREVVCRVGRAAKAQKGSRSQQGAREARWGGRGSRRRRDEVAHIRRTDSRTAASWIARLHDVVVLPTPPARRREGECQLAG